MIKLSSSELRLSVLPQLGAAVHSMHYKVGDVWVPVFQPGKENPASALDCGLFWMSPFANRARDNRLGAHVLKPNTAEPLALHGAAWQRAWTVTECSPSHCRLALEVGAGSFAYAFAVAVSLTLKGAELTIQLTIANRDRTPVAAGFGVHPYFPRRPSTRLQFRAERYWLEGVGHLPTGAVAMHPVVDFANGSPLPMEWRNNCNSGWDGRAEIEQPDLGYRLIMTADDCLRELMLFVDPQLDRFALEPQSHTSGATQVNPEPPATGTTLLYPGDRLETRLVFRIEPLN